jgi:hypothetical protein
VDLSLSADAQWASAARFAAVKSSLLEELWSCLTGMFGGGVEDMEWLLGKK